VKLGQGVEAKPRIPSREKPEVKEIKMNKIGHLYGFRRIARKTRIVRRTVMSRRWQAPLLIAALLVAAAAAPVAAQAHRQQSLGAPRIAAVVPSPPYTYIYDRNSGKCLEVPGYSTTAGTQIDQWTCVNQNNVLWLWDHVAQYEYVVRSGNSTGAGLCLNVKGNSMANGAAIIQWPCDTYGNTKNEVWFLYTTKVANGYAWYEIESESSRKCLSINGGSKLNGAKLIQYTCDLNSNNENFVALDVGAKLPCPCTSVAATGGGLNPNGEARLRASVRGARHTS
jgi:Ricin-type beta-trefoil lectin domain